LTSTEATSADQQSQVYDDPQNSTYGVLTQLLTEMASLFPDEVFHVGSDETSSVGPCTIANTKMLEEKLLSFVEKNIKKQPMAWVNALTSTGAAATHPDTILGTWATVCALIFLLPAVRYRVFCYSSTLT
jgi:N-acetyl-beta-hexosaminidase